MAVLPWGHSRNHTSSSTEKTKTSTLDWLSRSTAEPSRQAINQLMKQHTRGSSGGSAMVRGRPGAGTPTSQHRSASSVNSKKESTAVVRSRKSNASPPRPATPVRPSTSNLERSDSGSKSLFQKGGLLRRQGSKMSLSFSANLNTGVVSPSRPSSSRAGFRGKDVPASPIGDDDRRPSISKPFDFTHIMHGDINAFSGLGRIDESDLALQFDAIQERYRNTTEFGQLLPREPQSLTPTQLVDHNDSTTALPQISSTTCPSTPPPAPPPKNSPALSPPPSDIRISRSTENFSRPTPRSPTSPSTSTILRPSSCHLQNVTTVAQTSESSETAARKPLPQLPGVVHAVSTQDDTARLLISAPLPSPPPSADRGFHKRQSSSKGSLRHMSSFPSSRNPQNGLSTQDGQLLGIKEEDGVTRPHSDYELNQHAYRRQSERHASMLNRSLQVEDWEIAIDSAWDFEDEADLPHGSQQRLRPVSVRSKNRESYLTVEQPVQEEASSPSTPLMTMPPVRRLKLGSEVAKPSSTGNSGDSIDSDNQKQHALVGLGIATVNPVTTTVRSPQPPALEIVTSGISRLNASPRLTRSAYSAISHSSSQESIILSIASSIMSTQRSSVSSISVSEFTNAGKSDRSSTANSTTSPLLTINTQKPARPESGCLPSALLSPMSSDEKKTARPDSTCLPSIPSSKRNSVVSKTKRPESARLSREITDTSSASDAKSQRGQRRASKHLDARAGHEDDISELPSEARGLPGTRTSGSSRMSTVTNGDGIPTARRRLSSSGSRTRQARVSYSLFPTAGPAAANSNIEVQSVLS